MNDSFKVVKDYFKEVNKEVNVITTFVRKNEHKQLKYEKSVLRDISVKALKERVQAILWFFENYTKSYYE